MRAIVQDRYGPPEKVLRLRDIDLPEAGDGEVLVRVRATTAHADVWHAVIGRPYVLRLIWAGLLRPRDPVPGTDVAGIVESVGGDVTRFRPGDEVFGETRKEYQWKNGGAFAEYVSVPQEVLAPVPAGVTFEQAVSVVTGGIIALINLHGGKRIRPGQSVLVNGAGGGVGALAVQLAKAYGARVTGVDDSEKMDMIRSLGADEVIDYTREDFTRREECYDLILDVASTLTLSEFRRALKPTGIYTLIGHDHYGARGGRVLGSFPKFLKLMALSPFVRHLPKPSFSAPDKKEIMLVLAKFLEDGTLTPVIDRAYSLEEAAKAMRYLQEGRALGRIVITP